jgi:hypothetical protein
MAATETKGKAAKPGCDETKKSTPPFGEGWIMMRRGIT